MRYLFGFVSTVALSASPLSALAQGPDSLVVSREALGVPEQSDVDSGLADLEAAYQEANVRKPRAGVAVSVIAITGGVAALMAGVVFSHGIFGQPSERDQRIGGGLMAVGSITIAAGVGGLGFSGFRLKRAKRERRRLKPEIERLRSAVDFDAE
jgi:hypothetical protein